MLFRLPAYVVMFGLALASLASLAFAQNETWQVSLKDKQKKGYSKYQLEKGPRAFAISPDGAWGYRYGDTSVEVAKKRALQNCRQHMRPRQRDCVVYDVNGKRVLPEVIQSYRVSALYRPLDAKSAAAFFGLKGGSFEGNLAQAKQEFKPFHKGQLPHNSFVPDPTLTELLTQRSLMTTTKRPTVIWFGDKGGEQLVRGDSSVASNTFPKWAVSRSGLACLYDGVWDSGKIIGDRCIFLKSLSNGQVRFSWAGKWGRTLKGQLVNGDARFAAVR